MKHIKKFNEYATNEGMFDMFKSDEKIDRTSLVGSTDVGEIAEKVQDPENYDIVELGTPDHKSIEDIEEGDVFIDANSAKMRANGQFEKSKATWNIYTTYWIYRNFTGIKIKYIFKSGRRSNEVVDIPMNEFEKWFSHKIKFEPGFYRVLKKIGKKFINPNI